MVGDEDRDVLVDEAETEPEQVGDGVAAETSDEAADGQTDSSTEDEDVEEEYELVEIEIDEDDVVRYLEDDEGARIGFVLLEDGEEAEYFYVVDDEGAQDDEEGLGITSEGVAQATNDVNAIYRDGIAVAAELKDAFADIKSVFDFSAFTKK